MLLPFIHSSDLQYFPISKLDDRAQVRAEQLANFPIAIGSFVSLWYLIARGILEILPISGLTAIEAWMLACILFVFGALVEYAAILFRRQKDEVAEVSRPDRLILPLLPLSTLISLVAASHAAC